MATTPMSRVVGHLRKVALLQEADRLTDAQLLESFLLHGEEASFEALVRRHGPMILGVCRRVLHDRHDSEDAFQATFLVLLRKASSIGKRELLVNWLYGVAYRTALKARNATTRRRVKERQVRDMAQKQITTDGAIQDLLPLLDQELSRLPDKYRVPIILCDLEGKTRKKAAQQLRLPESTLSMRLDRARAMLAKRLARHGKVFSGGALALAVSQSMASPSVPPSLVSSTVKIGALVVAGKTGAAAAISAKVAALTEGVVKTMLLTKLKTMAAGVALLGVIAFGGGLLLHRTAGAFAVDEVKQETPPTKSAKVKNTLAVQEPKLRDTLIGHSGAVTSVAFSPDGKTLASASSDHTIKLWDVTSAKEQTTIRLTDKVYSVKYTPDGKTLASASANIESTIQLWDVASGKEMATFKGNTDRAGALAYSPDSKALASAYLNPRPIGTRPAIKLWDVATGAEQASLHGHKQAVVSIVFSPDGRALASGSADSTIRLWDIAAPGLEKAILKGHKNTVGSLVYSPDGKTLASGSADKAIKLWDVATNTEKANLHGHTDSVWSVAYTPDGKTLASGSADKTIKLWDVATGRETTTLMGHSDAVMSVAFSPDGKILASASHDKTITLWDMQAALEIKKENKRTTREQQKGPPKYFTNSIGMKFVWIAPGAFMMGSPQEEEGRMGDELHHRVTLTKGFYLGAYLVTQEQWRKVMGKNPSEFGGEKDLPVDSVSWDDCHAFITKLREKDKNLYRLPTEAEWEFACRSGTKTPFYFGKTISTDQANFDGNLIYGNGKKGLFRARTTPVGAFPANAWGLYDMHGNLWQWCEDRRWFYSGKDVGDPQGPEPRKYWTPDRMLRGGSWDDIPGRCRSACRFSNPPDSRGAVFGFRVAMTYALDEPKQGTPPAKQVDGQKQNQADGSKTKKQPGIEKRSGYLEFEQIDLPKGAIKGIRTTNPEGSIVSSLGELELLVTPMTKITIDGKAAQLGDLQAIKPDSKKRVLVVEWEHEALKPPNDLIQKGKATRIAVMGIQVNGLVQNTNAVKHTINIKEMRARSLGGDIHPVARPVAVPEPQENRSRKTLVERFADLDVVKEVEVIINGKAAGFNDLKPNMKVSMRMSAVKNFVLGITAYGAKVEGVVKSVDTEKGAISFNIPSAQITAEGVPVAKDAEVIIDGTEGKLSDLKAGIPVTLQMSADPDQSLVIGITARKATER
jgi:RNA polymerase sigma factor (sigma-70 family)